MKDKKAALENDLKTNVLNITFKKVDGSVRTMLCTLQPDKMPEYTPSTTPKKKQNENTVGVWDLEKNAFRSFRYDSLIEYTIQSPITN
jgi:hypothetical protein